MNSLSSFVKIMATLGGAVLMSCSGGSEREDPGPPADFSGMWGGSWAAPDGSTSGSLYANTEQDGASVSGTLIVYLSPCFTSGNLSGNVSGAQVTLDATSGSSADTMRISGNISGSHFDGSYAIAAGTCSGVTGTVSMDRVP
jgi:hypothetical protein